MLTLQKSNKRQYEVTGRQGNKGRKFSGVQDMGIESSILKELLCSAIAYWCQICITSCIFPCCQRICIFADWVIRFVQHHSKYMQVCNYTSTNLTCLVNVREKLCGVGSKNRWQKERFILFERFRVGVLKANQCPTLVEQILTTSNHIFNQNWHGWERGIGIASVADLKKNYIHIEKLCNSTCNWWSTRCMSSLFDIIFPTSRYL